MKIGNDSFFLEINPISGIVILIAFLCGYLPQFFIVFFSTALHEAGHIIAAAAYGMKTSAFKIQPVGFNAYIKIEDSSGLRNVILYLSGPLVNCILFVLFSVPGIFCSDYLKISEFSALSNIYLALFNLLPVLPLDGGKILRELLYWKIGFFSAGSYIRRISAVLSVALILLGAFQLQSGKFNFSLFLAGLYIFYNLKNDNHGEAAFMNIKSIIFRRSRLLKRKIYPIRDVAAIKTLNLGEVIKFMDFDRFHFIYVLDEDLKILKLLSEQEILDGVIKYGAEFTLSELCKSCEVVSS